MGNLGAWSISLDMVLQEIFWSNKLLINEWWFLEAGPRCTNRTKIFDGFDDGSIQNVWFFSTSMSLFCCFKACYSPENSPFFSGKMMLARWFISFQHAPFPGDAFVHFRGGNFQPLSWQLGLLKNPWLGWNSVTWGEAPLDLGLEFPFGLNSPSSQFVDMVKIPSHPTVRYWNRGFGR